MLGPFAEPAELAAAGGETLVVDGGVRGRRGTARGGRHGRRRIDRLRCRNGWSRRGRRRAAAGTGTAGPGAGGFVVVTAAGVGVAVAASGRRCRGRRRGRSCCGRVAAARSPPPRLGSRCRGNRGRSGRGRSGRRRRAAVPRRRPAWDQADCRRATLSDRQIGVRRNIPTLSESASSDPKSDGSACFFE